MATATSFPEARESVEPQPRESDINYVPASILSASQRQPCGGCEEVKGKLQVVKRQLKQVLKELTAVHAEAEATKKQMNQIDQMVSDMLFSDATPELGMRVCEQEAKMEKATTEIAHVKLKLRDDSRDLHRSYRKLENGVISLLGKRVLESSESDFLCTHEGKHRLAALAGG